MDLKLLRYFVTLAEELHFANAAARLSIAQPSLSIQIREMERRLGGKLFERTKRNVRLTKAGAQFLIDARDVLQRAERAERQIESVFRGEAGRIDLGFSSIAAYSGLLRRTVRCIRAHAPGLEIVLHELEPRAQARALETRQIDLALTPTFGVNVAESVECLRLADWPMELAVAGDHPLAALEQVTAQQILAQPFIAFASPLMPTPPRAFEEVLGAMPVITQTAHSASLVLAMVGAGLGVSLLPRALEGLASMNHVVFRPITGVGAQVDCSLILLRNAEHPITPDLRAALRAEMGSEPQ